MNRKREAILVGLGILAGLALSGPASAAVDYLQAKPSNQAVYVDGQKADMEAYFIHDNNFVMLRDIGEAVGFNVYWDGSAVQVESGKPYTGAAPGSTQPPVELTEESVRASILALREIYPRGTNYGAPYHSTSNGPYGAYSSNCAGWATLCSDTAFGDLPWRRVINPRWEDIRAGDLVRYDTKTSGHVVVVLNRTAEYISVTESGTTNEARWGGQYFKWWLEEQPGYTLYTRYPN